jgi:peptidoglycan/LPS O-acetylase OafA/YrhL
MSEEVGARGGERIHFPKLDGLRSVAALAVVVAHIECFFSRFSPTLR